MLTTAALAASGSLAERLLLEAFGPLVTVILGGVIVGLLTRRYQQKHEDRLRRREENRQDDQARRERLARDDALRHELVTMMTDCASTWFLATQHFQRMKGELEGEERAEKYLSLRDSLDQQYLRSRAVGQALEYRLGGYFASERPKQLWHAVQDLLTVTYFQVTDRGDDFRWADYAGDAHSGLGEDVLLGPEAVRKAYHRTMHTAVEEVFTGALTERSEQHTSR